jgi:hypothetical protein
MKEAIVVNGLPLMCSESDSNFTRIERGFHNSAVDKLVPYMRRNLEGKYGISHLLMVAT